MGRPTVPICPGLGGVPVRGDPDKLSQDGYPGLKKRPRKWCRHNDSAQRTQDTKCAALPAHVHNTYPCTSRQKHNTHTTLVHTHVQLARHVSNIPAAHAHQIHTHMYHTNTQKKQYLITHMRTHHTTYTTYTIHLRTVCRHTTHMPQNSPMLAVHTHTILMHLALPE